MDNLGTFQVVQQISKREYIQVKEKSFQISLKYLFMELRYQFQEYCLHEHKNNQLQGKSPFQKHVATVLSLLGIKVNEKEDKSPLKKK